jgi:hypothetical protein
MGKISLYILLTLIYIGFSISVISINENRPYLKSEKNFDSFFSNAPISVILIKTFKKGFFLKSYFLKLRVVHGYFPYEEIVFQTPESIFSNHQKNLGMAIYQRKSIDTPGNLIPQPAGSIFVGDLTFGSWVLDASGEKVWEFHRAFRFFPEFLGWGKFRPSQEFLQRLKISESYNKPFYGLENEFGTSGSVSSKIFSNSNGELAGKPESFLSHLKNLFSWKQIKDQKNE